MIDSFQSFERLEDAASDGTVMPRVEESDLDVRMRVDYRGRHVAQLWMRFIFQHRRKVVQDKAHPDTPIGRIDDALQQQIAAFVTPPDVVLQIERVPGRIN